mgnify:CR=1 FL=1
MENSWNFVENFCQFYKRIKICRNVLLVIVFFVFYIDSVSVASTVAEITRYRVKRIKL